MNRELLKIITEIFPSFSPYIESQVKEALKENKRNRQIVTINEDCDEILQGDIFDEIDFIIYKNNEPVQISLPGMIISNTCDIVRNKTLVFVPIVPIAKVSGNEANILRNEIFNLFYLEEVDKAVINFDYIQYIPRELFEKKIKQTKSRRLTQYGFYLLLIKLSIYLMRVESSEVQRIME